jgi:hypothetical protein
VRSASLAWARAGADGHACARRARRPSGRGRGAPPGCRARVRNRRPRRSRVPGGEGARPQRNRLGRARLAGAPDHCESRAGGAPQGGLGLRPPDRPLDPRRLRSDPTRPARRARRRRRARPRRAAAAGRRRARSCGGGAPGRPVQDPVCRPLRARGGSCRHRAGAASPSRRGRRLPAGRRRARAVRREQRSPAAGRIAPRSRRRSRPGAGTPRARDRRDRGPQPSPRRAARDREVDACPTPARDPAAALDGRGARGDADSLGGRHARRRPAARHLTATALAALQRLGGRARGGRRFRAAARGGQPRSPRSARARRVRRVPTAGARGASPAARRRRRLDRARRGQGRLPGPLPARGGDEPLSVRGARGSCGRVQVLAAAAR